jgi:hypothetical protein
MIEIVNFSFSRFLFLSQIIYFLVQNLVAGSFNLVKEMLIEVQNWHFYLQ